MKKECIKEIIAKIKNVKVAVYGDFCLDAYWMLDPRGSEVSVETGLQAGAVARHYYSLGGASNVVANLAALCPASIKVIGVLGDDIFGREITRQFETLGVDTADMVIQKENFNTVTFGKQYLKGNEQPRIDFGFFNKRSLETDQALLTGIEKALQSCDSMIINQQVPGVMDNDDFVDGLNRLLDKYTDKVVLLDSRHYGSKFKNLCRKTNDLEAALLNGANAGLDDVFTREDIMRFARNLYAQSNKPVFVTRGLRGMITVDDSGIDENPGIQLMKKLDTVGAGDTVTSALALCLGGDVKSAEAASFANFAAAVTVQKLFQTGTASGDEIIAVGQDPDYVYQPELACDMRKAVYFADSEVEYCYENITIGNIKHAVFDHDGTISTLRQGWEEIMVPAMLKAILGDEFETADEALYHKAKKRVEDYIDQSTGIQTILQMEALVEMVREFGIVPTDKILDKFGYKEIYNDALMELVNQRIEKFHSSQLDISDFTIKGSVEFLKELSKRSVTLYLASGTDKEDVIEEANALGYGELFNGGIYGSVGDVSKYSKKMVIEKIMTDNNLSGSDLVVFGDGPVEIREVRKRDGIAFGIASDEIRRHGLNAEKRTRLIKSGAHFIAPDFSQFDRIIKILFKE